jgi:hypothetical protein
MAAEDNMDYEDADDLAREARKNLQEWESAFGGWVEEARVCYAMLHGDQWTAEDEETLRAQQRPTVTMNRIAAMIRGVCGLEVSQRQEVRYLAPELGDIASTEVQNAAGKWAREQCDAEDEESEAFRDLVTTGMGWTETRVDYDEDPEGKLVVERIDPLDMRWDALAVKKGLADSRWRARLKRMTIKDVKSMWPDKSDDIAAYVESTEGRDLAPHVNKAGDQYADDHEGRPVLRDEAVLVQYQYWTYTFWAKLSMPDGQIVDMPADRADLMKQEGVPLVELQRFRKREYRQAILCGPVILEDVKLNCSNFTLVVMTGVRDRNKGYWYGLVRDMVDPQRWANKFFSTYIDIIASNAKGGVMAETTAVEDPRKFETSWSNPRATVWLKAGGLGKIQSREAPAIPQGIGQVMEFAINSLPQVSAINLEFLGTTNRDQSGVLEYHRKQSVANSLAEFFAAMRQYRKMQGRVMLELIYTFLADNRLIRIVGKDGEQYVPLMRQADVKYDVVVDESPSSPDRKMQTWLALEQLLPMALQAGLPVPPGILDYSPLPSSLSQEWKKMLSEKPPLPPEVMQQQQQMGEELQRLQRENQQLKDKRQLQEAEMAMRTRESEANMALKEREAMFEMQQKQREAEFEMRQAEREAEHELRLAEFKARNEIRIKEHSAVLDAVVAEQQNDTTKVRFEKQNGKVVRVTDGAGRVFAIERDENGKLIGLQPATETIQ